MFHSPSPTHTCDSHSACYSIKAVLNSQTRRPPPHVYSIFLEEIYINISLFCLVMKIENVEVDKKGITSCLDIAYHELRYVYKKQPTFASETIRSKMQPELRILYYKNPEFRKKLNSVLRYAVRYGQSVIAYAEGRKKRCRMPRIEDRKLDDTDLELLVGLHKEANLGPSLIEE